MEGIPSDGHGDRSDPVGTPLPPPQFPPEAPGQPSPPLPPPPVAAASALGMPGADGTVKVSVVQEGLGRSMVRSGLKALAVVAVLSIVPMFMLFMVGAVIASIAGSVSSEASNDVAGGPLPKSFLAGDRGGETQLVAVPITGAILGENRDGASSFFAPSDVTYGYSVKERLLELADDDNVDGVLLEMSTPGGTIFGSKAIADGVEAYQAATGKPVVAYVADISASGGMYAMAGADEIVADHGTLIGSIGIIFGPFTHFDGVTALDGGLLGGGVTTDGGITFEYLTAGRHKDLGSPYREMTAEERGVLQAGLDDAYDAFVDHVAAGRDLPAAEIETKLGALIYGETQAKANGLIDTIGSREDAYARLAELAGAQGDNWRLDRVGTSESSLWSLLGASTSGEGQPAAKPPLFCTSGPTFMVFHGDPSSLCSKAN